MLGPLVAEPQPPAEAGVDKAIKVRVLSEVRERCGLDRKDGPW